MRRVLTIGVYGATREAFFETLSAARADVVVDVRRRRAVRGSMYSYANARRLMAGLELCGIAYIHVLGLAPTRELLELQHGVDAAERLRYSQRTVLAPEYVRRYEREVLASFDFAALARELHGRTAPALLCVERIPQACHRSLVAPRLAAALGIREVLNLIPDGAR